MNSEDAILQKVKEMVSMDLTKLKYTEVPHLLLLVAKIVYEDNQLSPDLQKDLIIKITQILIDKSDMSSVLKGVIKDMVPHLVDKYIEIDNGSMKIKITTYGRTGRMWIKIRTYLDRKILGV